MPSPSISGIIFSGLAMVNCAICKGFDTARATAPIKIKQYSVEESGRHPRRIWIFVNMLYAL